MPGRLIVCATPIGNLGDVSTRLAMALAEADLIFAEDTRRSRTLLDHLGIRKPLRSWHAGNEAVALKAFSEALVTGATIALLTDAGTPAISDPGMTAVVAARQAGATVTVIPGPSAVTAAVAVSGLPSDRFVFEGFLPRKGAARRSRLELLDREERTAVVFVAPHHFHEDLSDLADALGGRPLTITRELTKAFEEVWWGDLIKALAEWEEREPQGEFTLVIGGREPVPPSLDEAHAQVLAQIGLGSSMTAAVRQVASETGVSRRQLYQQVLDSMSAQAPPENG